MDTNDIFQQSKERQAEIAAQQKRHDAEEQIRRQEGADRIRNNVAAIDARLRTALDYLVTHEFPAAEKHGYDIKHNFRLTRTPTSSMQSYSTLELYMKHGGVINTFGEPPYEADYQLTFIGNGATGCVTARSFLQPTGQREELGSFNAAAELSDVRLRDIFQSFITSSLRCEEERTASSPQQPVRNRIGTPQGY